MDDSSTHRVRIYQRFLDACRPLALPAAWDQVNLNTNARSLPLDLPAVMAQLATEFSAAELIDSGVASRGSDGALVHSAAFEPENCVLLPLRREPHAAPYDILVPSGCLSSPTILPALSLVHDYRFCATAGRWDFVLVVSSLVELVLVRGLGLPASLALGLDNCRPVELEQCIRQLRWPPPNATTQASEAPGHSSTEFDPSPSSPPDPQVPPNTARSNPQLVNRMCDPGLRVIFVGWELDSLDPGEPIAMAMIRDNLYLIESSHDVDLIGVNLWSPSAEEIAQLQRVISTRSPKRITGKIVQSLSQCSRFLGDEEPPPIDFAAVYSDYLLRLREGNDRAIRDATAKLAEAFDEGVVMPSVTQAMNDQDLPTRSLQLFLAELERIAFTRLHSGKKVIAMESVDEILKIMGKFVTISQILVRKNSG